MCSSYKVAGSEKVLTVKNYGLWKNAANEKAPITHRDRGFFA